MSSLAVFQPLFNRRRWWKLHFAYYSIIVLLYCQEWNGLIGVLTCCFSSWKVYTRELSLKKEWAGSSLRFFLMVSTRSPLFLYTTCGGSRAGGFHKCVTLAAPNRYNQEQNVPRDWREIRHIPFRASRINHPEGHSPLYRKMVLTFFLNIFHSNAIYISHKYKIVIIRIHNCDYLVCNFTLYLIVNPENHGSMILNQMKLQ